MRFNDDTPAKSLISCTLALSFVAAVALAAQERPNFSGTWQRADPSGDATTPRMTITQDGTSFTVEDAEHKMRLEFGKEARLPSHLDVEVVIGAAWKGRAMVVTSTFKSRPDGGTISAREDVWSLDTAGQLVIEVTRRRADRPPVTEKSVWQRRP